MPLDKETLQKILGVFRDELIDFIDQITEALVQLENNQADSDELEAHYQKIMRIAHTIKGSARAVELDQVSELAHRLEDLFAPLMETPRPLSNDMTTLCYQILDVMQNLVNDKIAGNTSEIDLPALQTNISQMQAVLVGMQEAKPAKRFESVVPVLQTQIRESMSISLSNIVELSRFADEMLAGNFHLGANQKKLVETFQSLSEILRQSNYHLARSHFPLYQALKKVIFEFQDHLYQSNYCQRHLTSLSAQLQDALAQVRLVQAKEVLNPLVRVAKDSATVLKKLVKIEVQGGDVEVDRLILQTIKDPLIHLVRNAIDHGIESEVVRHRLNKPNRGVISIEASLKADRFILTISDDGGGIDIDKIKQVACEKQLITAEQAGSLSESQLLELIFHPGFSIKKEVSQISGRGVGLDLVRNELASVQGKVTIDSIKNKGTCFTLDLPILLSANRGLVITCDGQNYVLPSQAVDYIVPVQREQLQSDGKALQFHWKNQALDCYPLQQLLTNTAISTLKASYIAVVIRTPYLTYTLLVDQVLSEGRVIVKPLLAPFSALPGITGACQLESEAPTLMLSPAGLIAF